MTDADYGALEQSIFEQIKQLTDGQVWPRIEAPRVNEWLGCFDDPGSSTTRRVRLHALFLLSRFMYFGEPEIRALLKALFRDHYKYKIISSARRAAGDTLDQGLLTAAYEEALQLTRFLGVGNPSESGTHLLYQYRQENELATELFITEYEIFDLRGTPLKLKNPDVTRYIFLDDFCGSGSQVVERCESVVRDIHDCAARMGVAPAIEYHVLCGLTSGLDRVRRTTLFDDIVYTLELDDSYRAFTPSSRYFKTAPDGIEMNFAEFVASYFGAQLWPRHPRGFSDGQLMLGFFHNTPDNTLPIFWHHGSSIRPWRPIFARYYK
jgi:hypothetical protein